MHTQFPPLAREEVIKAVERRNPSRIPLIMAHWWGEGLGEQYGQRLQTLEKNYPEDATIIELDLSNYSDWGLPWPIHQTGSYDSRSVLDDWKKIDEFIAHIPKAENDVRFEQLRPLAERAHRENRYLIFLIWRLFFERPWEIRGMQNLLMDYHGEPENIHRLHESLCNMYIDYLQRAIRELQPDGYWTSDDLGHQSQLFMRPETFRAFHMPYYRKIGTFLKEKGLHWWLHSCGNNTLIMGDLIEAGLTVFHPVQKGTMDEAEITSAFGPRLSFLAGFDVQHILQEGSPEEVRREVRFLIDTFDRPEGGMCMAAGNGIVAGTPFENIEAFLDEAVGYGIEHRKLFA